MNQEKIGTDFDNFLLNEFTQEEQIKIVEKAKENIKKFNQKNPISIEKHIISAEEAREICKLSIKNNGHNDLTKMATIMKNIKERTKKGNYYVDYHSRITYPMAKTLMENGYILRQRRDNKILELDDFKLNDSPWVRIFWCNKEEIC